MTDEKLLPGGGNSGAPTPSSAVGGRLSQGGDVRSQKIVSLPQAQPWPGQSIYTYLPTTYTFATDLPAVGF